MQSAVVVDRQPGEPGDTKACKTTDLVPMIGAADISRALSSGSGCTLENVVAVTSSLAVAAAARLSAVVLTSPLAVVACSWVVEVTSSLAIAAGACSMAVLTNPVKEEAARSSVVEVLVLGTTETTAGSCFVAFPNDPIVEMAARWRHW